MRSQSPEPWFVFLRMTCGQPVVPAQPGYRRESTGLSAAYVAVLMQLAAGREY
jgi:hypothetical protein